MADHHQKGHIFTIFITFSLLGIHTFAEPEVEKKALLTFISKVGYNKNHINWDAKTNMCHNWTGVVCTVTDDRVCELRLPGSGLNGQIPENTIGKLTNLRVLSLRNNKLFGPVPSDWGNLRVLLHLFLPNNKLSGQFPESITKMKKLRRLDISYNMFDGNIPASINNLKLERLFLQHNQFYGPFPEFLDTSIMTYFDVTGNNFSGEIPVSLSTFSESSFYGNVLLCGKPLSGCRKNPSSALPPPTQPPLNTKEADRLPTHAVAIINFMCVMTALFFITLLVYCIHKRCRRRTKQSQLPISSLAIAGEDNSNQSTTSKENMSTCELSKYKRLVFFQTENYKFDLQALFGASAEVLGKGSTGMSYKAEMDDGTTVAVKRMKEVVVTKKEFETQMALLGQLNHPNVLRLVAYYYSKDEKLVISEYIPAGSLTSLLHARRESGRLPLGWLTRFKIGLTAAKGLHHIHTAAKIPHGNIKSSNILVTQCLEACVSDYGMNSLLGPSTPNLVTDFKAPEVQQNEKGMSFKSDVYSFGVVLLEMLTGKSPCQVTSVGEDGFDLPRWVRSVVGDDFATEVFDCEVLGSGADEEIMAVLQVAMKCVDLVADKRPEMWEVVRMLEMIATGDSVSFYH